MYDNSLFKSLKTSSDFSDRVRKVSVFPIDVIRYYFKNGSLRKTAKEFGIHYNTLWKWVKDYRIIQDTEGRIQHNKKQILREKLLTGYRRHWRRIPEELEQKIVLLKEQNPVLTVRKAREILKKQGIEISIKGIWGVWKRCGYAGFEKQNMTNDWTEYCKWSDEARNKIDCAISLFNSGNIKKSAEVLNSIPFIPKNNILHRIPDRYLNIRRQVEKLPLVFGKMPIKSYLKKAGNLYELCRKKGLNYLALRAGIMEIIALEWTGRPDLQLKKIKELKKIMKMQIQKDKGPYPLFEPYFTLLVSEGIAFSLGLRIQKDYHIIKKCNRFLKNRKYVSPYFVFDLAVLYFNVEHYRLARKMMLKAVGKVDKRVEEVLLRKLAETFLIDGKYKEALKLLRTPKLFEWTGYSRVLLSRSIASLVEGKVGKAIDFSTKAFNFSRKEDFIRDVFLSSFMVASSYCALGDKHKARKELRKAIPFLKRNGLKRETGIIEALLSKKTDNLSSLYKEDLQLLPTIRLALMTRSGRYVDALKYAKRKGILSYFYRYIFFFPEPVISRLKKGKPVYLPKSILKLPVFNKSIFVFDIRFLGKLMIYRSLGVPDRGYKFKEKELLRLSLTPKEKSFLIHLALRLPEPGRTISLEKIYKNFWKNSKKPERNLSHLLSKVRKQLKIPVHLLEISRRGGYPVLKNNGIYFLTDYMEFKETVAKAGAVLRAGEFEFARKEFKQAFRLVRGEPFRKMYDRWSEDKRTEIIFKIRKDLNTFVNNFEISERELKNMFKGIERFC